MDRWLKLLVAAAAVSAGIILAAAEPAGAASDAVQPSGTTGGSAARVWLVEFDGALGPATADLIVRSIDSAGAAGASALIIRMDTPGGLDKSMRQVVQAILAAEIPVITYVAPGGARAASAGTYIAYASHIAAMAPASNIGSSTPVSIAPQPSLPVPAQPQPSPDGEGAPEGSATAPVPGDAMTRKVINDAVAYLQSLAELRGRNIEWAEATVREGANLRASEALELNVIDLISRDLDELLQAVDGLEVKLSSGSTQLRTAGAAIHFVESDWQHDLLELITDPTIAYGLLIIGIYGLMLEFYNPGMVLPAVVGVICLLLGAYGLQMLPVNYAGLALILVGIGMMVAEIFTPTFGVLGVAGVAAFAFGSVMLLDTQSPGYSVPLSVIAAFTVSTGALVVLGIGAAVRARGQAVRTGPEAFAGAPAVAIETFESTG
ncbi:MAG: nodulation protein NfeD, partial [Pseudomonadales bacterium]|nr:nodulation protein NfeD [Pseudomonadales bacterium]